MENIKNIVLTGFMMAGKSTVGRSLAELLRVDYIDTDEMIVKKEGRSINDIFAESGEEYFRCVEKDAIKEAAKIKEAVISCGGGVVLDPENIDILRKNGIIVNINITPEVIKSRIETARATRPLIKDLDIEGVLKKLSIREEFYKNCDYRVLAENNKPPVAQAKEIIELLERNGEI